MSTVQCLRQNVSTPEALAELCPGGIRGALQSVRWGPLRSLAKVYVPFRLYRVNASNRERRQSLLLAVDAVRGTLDPYGFERVPGAEDLVPLETRNALPPAFDEARTRELARDVARRQFYAAGFFRLRNLSLEAEWIPGEFHVPYLIGFFGRGTHAKLAVMDTVRRRREGAKARAFFENWLLSALSCSQ